MQIARRLSLSINLHNLKNGVWGVAPSGVRAAAPRSAPARMPGVYAKGLCKDAKLTKHTQPFTGKRGFGIGLRTSTFLKKTYFFYKLSRRADSTAALAIKN